MEPMKPMKPMEPMEPMAESRPWWPEELGRPSSSGAQNEVAFAFFPQKQRLLVRTDGHVTTYDSGRHRISGVAQQQGSTRSLTFSSDQGSVDLADLTQV